MILREFGKMVVFVIPCFFGKIPMFFFFRKTSHDGGFYLFVCFLVKQKNSWTSYWQYVPRKKYQVHK